MNTKKAFTLVELMVVILILGILAALIIPRVVGKSTQAKIASAKSDISELHNMLTEFRLNCDRYPTTQEGLQALEVAPNNVKGWKGPYSDKPIPNDPWQTPYQYTYPGPNGDDSFLLESYGADGQQGGDGDNADIVDGQF